MEVRGRVETLTQRSSELGKRKVASSSILERVSVEMVQNLVSHMIAVTTIPRLQFRIAYIASAENLADYFTKKLTP
jgi:hypothetical protein